MPAHSPSTWLEIDLAAIRGNVRRLRELTAAPVMAVVKANGYGHGLAAAAQAAQAGGAGWLGVARLDEALQLRAAGLGGRILVLGCTPPDGVPAAVEHEIALTLYDSGLARACAGGVRVHVKVDTGMGRLGVPHEQAAAFFQTLRHLPGMTVEGVFTHFARADEPGETATPDQLARFTQLLGKLAAAGMRPPLVHAANSAAALNFPAARFDLVRPGIAIYGMNPAPGSPLPPGFQPALAWKARLSSVKDAPPGHGVSYGHRYVTSRRERLGVAAVGYADGFRRAAGNVVLIGGRRVPVVGNVTMDQVVVSLEAVPEAQVGDEVVLIGSQAGDTITAEEVAARWGTIAYEVTCGVAARVPRVYKD
jgi:alanine racemase